MKQYEIANPDGIVVGVLTPQDTETVWLKYSASDEIKLWVEGHDMWVEVEGGKYLTNNHPGDFIRMGLIKKKETDEDKKI